MCIRILALRIHMSCDTANILMKNEDFVLECCGVQNVEVW